ncbi:MAG: hypothetical protein JWM88_112 [Verrucomicrobia bacterium]|nr:hypothetical protein [Verrucomicrobiota bacterium]
MLLNPVKRRSIMVLMTLLMGVQGTLAGAEAGRLSDAEIARRFQDRRREVLDSSVAAVNAADLAKGGYFDVAACLQRGERVDAALARFAKITAPMPTENMFWMFPMVSVMMAGDRNLDARARARIAELWRTYWPSRGDTENHWAMYYSTLYLAAQSYPGAGPEKWFNGKSSAENMAEARSYLEHWISITTSIGQGEYDSPNYLEEYVVALCLLSGWADDPGLKHRAHMLLDYMIYDYAVESLEGYYGGAHSRVYPKQIIAPGQTPAMALGWLLFGFGERQANGTVQLLALSGYAPPPILERIARDRDRPYVERELKRTRWRMRNAGPESIAIGDKRTVPVYKYSYVDHDFILGSTQGGLLQPIQQQTWSLIWRTGLPATKAANTFFGLQPYSSPVEGTMYFGGDWDTLTDMIARSKRDYDTPDKLPGGSPFEQVFQQGAALVALYDIPEGTRFPLVTVFFSRDLNNTDEDASGWIFAQGGPAYLAYRPFAAGEWKPNDWTGLFRSGDAGWVGPGFSEWGTGHRCYVSGALRNGYVVQVAPARNFPSYEAFKSAVRALPLKFATSPAPEATFTTLDGTVLHVKYGAPPQVNKRPVDFSAWPLFESPFGHAKRGSHQLEIVHRGERLLLDFQRNASEQSALPAQP